jgi:hypothetical protein
MSAQNCLLKSIKAIGYSLQLYLMFDETCLVSQRFTRECQTLPAKNLFRAEEYHVIGWRNCKSEDLYDSINKVNSRRG